MTEPTVKKSSNWSTRIVVALLIFVLLLVLAVVGLRVWITSSSGARFIEDQVNSRQLGLIKRTEISGFSGDPLDEFSIASLKLYDRDGLWLSASDIQIEWAPWPIRNRHLVLEDLDIAEMDVLRRPVLEETKPSEPFTARIDDADIVALTLREALIGQDAVLKVDAQGGLLEGGAIKAALNVIRTDAAGDAVTLDFTRAANGDMTGEFTLDGAVGGTVATLLGAPESAPVTGGGRIAGTIDAGEGTATISFGEAQALDAKVEWTPEMAALTTEVMTTSWPVFDGTRETLGRDINLRAALNRAGVQNPFTARISAENFEADLSGDLGEDIGRPDALNFDIRSSRLGAVLPLPEGYALGDGRAQGRVVLGEAIFGNATLDVANIVTPYGRAANLSGPITLTPDGEAFNFDVKLTVLRPVTTQDLPIILGQSAVLTATGLADFDARRVTKLNAALTSGKDRVTAKGSLSLDASRLDISGTAKASLKPIGQVPAGQLDTTYSVRKTANSDPALSAAGNFTTPTGFAPPLDQLLGTDINYDIKMQPVEGGVRINDGRVRTENMRAAFAGRVTETLDLSAELSILEALTVGALNLTEPSEFSATVTGPRTDPNLKLDGTAPAVTVSGHAVTDVRLRTELTDLITAPKGPLRLEAETDYGPLDFSAELASTAAGYAARDIDLKLAGLTAGGDLALGPDNIATGRLELDLPQDGDRFVRAFIDLENRTGEQGVSVKTEAKNVTYGDFAIKSLMAEAEGTLTGLSGNIDITGRRTDTMLIREFGVQSPLTLNRSPETGYTLTLAPEADYGRYRISHSETVTLRYNGGEIAAEAPLLLNGQPVSLDYAKANGLETVRLRARDLPMKLLPLPGTLAESRGTLSVNLNARHSASEQLSGQGVVQIKDLRGMDIDEGRGLTVTTTLDLQPSSVRWRLENRTESDLKLAGTGQFTLIPGDNLAAIRPNMTAPMSGRFTASGSANPLLSLVTLDDAKPDGTLTAELELEGTLGAPLIEGDARGENLRLEIPSLGTRIRQGRFTAEFTNDTIDVRDVFVADAKDGTLQGGGKFKLGEFGRPVGRLEVKAKDFRALDRKDYEGQTSGTLYFESTAETATMGGDVKFDRAEVKQFVAGRVAVVEIEVEEINGRMDELDTTERPEATPIYLDLRIRAPRRIFVRTRGLDVELEMDVTLKGTTSAPEIYGTASVVRGGYRIAGKELAFSEGSIEFEGRLQDAKVNLVAETDTQNISATVNITGTVEKPEIELSSTPERPQDEILSALLFGRSVTELSTIEAAQLAGALAQFSGAGGGFDLLGGLRDALGVGQLSIGIDEDGQATVSGGRYLAKDVYLQVFTGAGPESTGAVIDWEIRKNLSLRSKVQADSQQSFSLQYKKDF